MAVGDQGCVGSLTLPECKAVPLDPRVKRFLDVLAAGRPPHAPAMTVQERRRSLAELLKLAGPQVEVGRIEDRILTRPGAAPLAVRIYTPLGADAEMLPGLVYFHGGGFVAGTLATHDSIARALANAGSCRVVSVEYRLAPENPFPAALDDALAAVTHVGDHALRFGIDGARLGICGDSAGATLAAATCQAVARIGSPRLALQVLICPILDYSGSTVSRRDLASGYLLDQATLDHDLLHYAPPGTDPTDPRISPLRADDVAGLPPTLIHTAEFDPVRDEGKDYFERLAKGHSRVSYTCHPGMIHLFYGLGGVIPYARTAFELIGREIRAAFAQA
ncbi:MAG TPA: alpha/beta hydrolase [Steroidobacteraceae bacterium]|jgi:acetyl esterase/lipase|nr:alpha/beta hydrolase [Steroidobacteraceae bacterium]